MFDPTSLRFRILSVESKFVPALIVRVTRPKRSTAKIMLGFLLLKGAVQSTAVRPRMPNLAMTSASEANAVWLQARAAIAIGSGVTRVRKDRSMRLVWARVICGHALEACDVAPPQAVRRAAVRSSPAYPLCC